MVKGSRLAFALLTTVFIFVLAASTPAFDSLREKTRVLQLISQVENPEIRLELKQNVLLGNIDSYEKLENIVITYLEDTEEKDRKLKRELGLILSDGYVSLGYRQARQAFFSDIDNIDGKVQCIYTGKLVTTSGIPNVHDMNTEHSWPQSFFNKKEPMRSDIHHLFPTDTRSNSQRGRYPFGEVIGTPFWEKGGSRLGRNQFGNVVFEVRPDHRGDTARAMFYFSIRYNRSIDYKQETTLRRWHKDDPVSDYEIMRNNGIERYQKNRNIFVDQPDQVDKISDF
ncbi:MAG: endonuclease [bacterium]|nr:endonuclease [bacterium]